MREDRGGQAHVAKRGAGALLGQRGDVGLPPETSDGRVAGIVGKLVDPSGDAVAVGVAGIGQRPQRRLGHQLQQAKANDRGRHARAHHHAIERTVSEIGKTRLDPDEVIGRAVAIRPRNGLGLGDRQIAFGRNTQNRVIVELVAVARILHRATVRASHRQPHQHRFHRRARRRRLAAPVTDMAAGAGVAVEGWTEPVEGFHRGRILRPFGVEHAIAEGERPGPFGRCVAGQERVGVVGGDDARGIPAERAGDRSRQQLLAQTRGQRTAIGRRRNESGAEQGRHDAEMNGPGHEPSFTSAGNLHQHAKRGAGPLRDPGRVRRGLSLRPPP